MLILLVLSILSKPPREENHKMAFIIVLLLEPHMRAHIIQFCRVTDAEKQESNINVNKAGFDKRPGDTLHGSNRDFSCDIET